MICDELANELEAAATLLRKHQDKFNARNVEKSLGVFQKALTKFRLVISAIAEEEEQSSDVRALNERLNSPAGRMLHHQEAFSAFTKIVLGKKFPVKKTETLHEAGERFKTHLLKNRLVNKAVKAFDVLIRNSIRPEINFDSEIELLREIRHMGSLDDDALEIAFATRYSDEKLLRKMAQAAHIQITSKSKPPGIAKKLIPYARNSFANTTF